MLAPPPAASVEAPKPPAAAPRGMRLLRSGRAGRLNDVLLLPPSGPERRPEVRPERKPFQRRDDERKTQDRPDRRPSERSGPPSRQGRTGEGRPYERRDRPFTPRDERAGDRPDRRPYQRSDAPGKTRDQKPYDRSGRPPKKADGRDQKPYDRDRRDDRPRKPINVRIVPKGGDRSAGRRRENRMIIGADQSWKRTFSGPRNDKRGERPGGGSRPPKGRGDRPFGPKRPGGGPPRAARRSAVRIRS